MAPLYDGWHKTGKVWTLWRSGVARAHVYLYPPQAARTEQLWLALCGALPLGSSPTWDGALRLAEEALSRAGAAPVVEA